MPSESGKQPVMHKKHVARLERERKQSQFILYAFIGILAAVILLLAYGYLDINYFQLKRPVAKVGETKILAGDFEARVRLQRQQLLGQFNLYKQYEQFGMNVNNELQQIQGMLDNSESLGQSVLDQMVNDEVIRQEAAKRGITASEAEIQARIEGSFDYYPNGTPTPSVTPTQFNTPAIPAEAFKIVTITPTPLPATAAPEATATLEPTAAFTATPAPKFTPTAAFTATPEPTATPYTKSGFEKELQSSQERLMQLGFSKTIYTSFFETQILQEKLKAAVTANVARSNEQIWARHILVSDEATAKSIVERVKKGEDFATLAKELSADTGSGANGGDLGWFGKGMMVPEFETAAFALTKPGDFTTTPVKSQYGFHIIQLIAKQNRPLNADEYQAALDTAFTDWLTAAKENYSVTIYDLWKTRVPSEPNFITIATDAANQQLTAVAEQKNATETPTVKP
ncbi:MAG: peptidylprolyl isomerase [Anaerolineales bacterium]|nr:peptidylprolyl isomerase [Anaerolineales bacterium]